MELRRTWYTIAEAEDPRLVHQVWLPLDSTIEDFMTTIKQTHPEIDYEVIVYQHVATEIDPPENCEVLLLNSFYSLDEPLDVRRRGSHKILRCRQDPKYRLILCNKHLESILGCIDRNYELPEKNLATALALVRSSLDCAPKRYCSTRVVFGICETEIRIRKGFPIPIVDLPDIFSHHEWILLEHVHRLCQTESDISPGIVYFMKCLALHCYRIEV